ncbi:galactokinase [Commensalibacter papalotli (ex Botero et al. 2024)]|uniref:Galactokinase n=1 Tax=Commensalibacter papalotli (ex Botero et al. 2024) TaxID=2972766 RepID=A0ABN8W7R4_9PROT|nr:galactokinase [Commensalibacter papalotli (ex Botero et al. 2024)]CAI3926023.1 Galactokinase (GalK) (PDB:1PIE) [Commensalibacter papalotli (ex Botero et al. 2024)]
MQKMIQETLSQFQTHYGYPAELVIQAPGRVNLIGEHTDYNDGFVLPCAINYSTFIASKKRTDHQVNIIAVDFDGKDNFDLSKPINKSEQGWANYVRGVFKYVQELHSDFTGIDLIIHGNVPLGAGLSSSAALEVSIATTIKTLYHLPIDPKVLAKICQKAENKFVGMNCGIMDQFISTLGEKDHALLIDCRNLETQSISMPTNLSVVIINSNVKHGLVDSEYNLRRQQCEEAAQILNVPKLRDATIELLEQHKTKMSNVVYRRAKHIITENTRTLEAAKALSENNITKLGELMQAGHLSMKDDFEITAPAVDALVDIVKSVLGNKGGVRMTGGGFGGCVVALAPHDMVEPIRKAVEKEYHAQTGLKESFYICHAMNGAGKVSI